MFSDPKKRSTGPARALAAILVVALTVAAVAPPLALAESDQEGEGTAPPGALPGLEPGEPGGPETTLEEVAPAPGEEETEEVAPTVTVESEPPPAVVTEAVPPAEATPPPPAAAPPQPEPAAPVYGTSEASPTYEPSSSSPSPAVVQNEAIVAPEETEASAPERATGRSNGPPAAPPPVIESTLPPVAPAEAPEQIASSPEPSPPAVERPGALSRHDTYTVAPGDCLWLIAAAVRPSGASNAEIEAEVARLWRINADRTAAPLTPLSPARRGLT